LIAKKWFAIGAAVVTAAAGAIGLSSAQATLSGATFEGNDGNIVVGPGPGGVDWANLVASGGTLALGVDQPTGADDNSFTQGSKEDDVNVTIGNGSIPNSKADIGKFAVGSQVIQSGARAGNFQMLLAWVRNNDGGTTNFDFEINQAAQPDMSIPVGSPPNTNRAITLNRTGDGPGPLVDDLLINYDLQGGASTPTLTIQRWQGTAWGQLQTLTSANSEGKINCVSTGAGGTCPNGAGAISAPNSGPFNQAIAATRFGEAAIDLTAIGIIPNQNDPNAGCLAFGSAYVKSRSSSAFTSQMKDYSAPIALDLDTCGSIEIKKVTDPSPDATATTFSYTRSGPGTLFDSNFTLVDGGSNKVSGLSPGSYTVTETDPGPNFVLDDLTCTETKTGNTTTLDATASIVLDANEDVVCTYTNTQQGTITVTKHTDPVGGLGQSFNFNPSYGPDFQLLDGESNTSGFLTPGTYDVSEDVPAGWDLTSTSCSDGSPVTAIDLGAGENITCEFNNQARGKIIIVKETDPDGSTDTFSFNPSYGAPFDLTDGQQNDSGPLVPGIFSVSETVPGGWDLIESVCSDGSDVSAIDVGPGETVTCVFTNQADAKIIVFKRTDPAGDTTQFDFTSDYGAPFSLADGEFNDSGDLDPGNYAVGETVPPGWELISATCNDGSDPASIALSAGETVACTFVNEKDANIIVRKETLRNEPGLFDFVTSYPPGGFTIPNGGSNDSGSLDPANYVVSEIVPPNWALVSATCSDGSAPAAVDLQAGETVICTFVNELQVGAIKIHKDRKHVADGPGDSPHAGVDFTVNGQTVTTDGNGDACVDGLFFGPYTVHEITPAGYADQVDQNVTVDNVAYCEDPFVGEQVFFVNMPLTNITVSVDSQIDGGTASVIDCGGANTGSTGPDGDGSVTVTDLEPTAPGVTLTCTIVVDP
jgi:Prealbumin-like fold domain